MKFVISTKSDRDMMFVVSEFLPEEDADVGHEKASFEFARLIAEMPPHLKESGNTSCVCVLKCE